MDDQPRFWIAQEVANTKHTADVRLLLELGKAVAGKKPKSFITDGAANFHEAYLKEFHTMSKATDTEHIRYIRLAGDHNNNRMERFNGELRQRENTLRPRNLLAGKTPPEHPPREPFPPRTVDQMATEPARVGTSNPQRTPCPPPRFRGLLPRPKPPTAIRELTNPEKELQA